MVIPLFLTMNWVIVYIQIHPLERSFNFVLMEVVLSSLGLWVTIGIEQEREFLDSLESLALVAWALQVCSSKRLAIPSLSTIDVRRSSKRRKNDSHQNDARLSLYMKIFPFCELTACSISSCEAVNHLCVNPLFFYLCVINFVFLFGYAKLPVSFLFMLS